MSKLEKKFNSWFWFILSILPLLYIMGSYWSYARSGAMQTGFFYSLNTFENVGDFLALCRFPVLADAFGSMFSGLFGVNAGAYLTAVFDYVSYVVFLEFLRIAVSVFLFLPRALSCAFDKMTMKRG